MDSYSSLTQLELNDEYFLACTIGRLDVVLEILPYIESIEVVNEFSRTGLAQTVRNGHTELAQFLVKMGASVHAVNTNGTTVFMFAKTSVYKSRNFKLLAWLLDQGVKINELDLYGKTVLDYVLIKDDQEMLSWLKGRGALFSAGIT